MPPECSVSVPCIACSRVRLALEEVAADGAADTVDNVDPLDEVIEVIDEMEPPEAAAWRA